jgi:hypothetical protein
MNGAQSVSRSKDDGAFLDVRFQCAPFDRTKLITAQIGCIPHNSGTKSSSLGAALC